MNKEVTFVLSLVIAFVITLLSCLILRPLAMRLELIDIPGGRKAHKKPVPLIGGIAIFFGFSFSLILLNMSLQEYRSILAACLLLVFVGLLDDFRELTAKFRLVTQVLAALLVIFLGHNVLFNLGALVGHSALGLGMWAIPFTVFAIVGLINAVNMVDGIDGLAGGITFVEIAFLLAFALQSHSDHDVKILAILLASLFAFLCLNFPIPKREQALVFMGDAGSMFLGLIIAEFAIRFSQGDFAIKPIAVLWVLFIPVSDTLSVMCKRAFQSKSIFHADRQHFHHKLQQYGFSPLFISSFFILLTMLSGAIGFIGNYRGTSDELLFTLYIVASLMFLCGQNIVCRVLVFVKRVTTGMEGSC